MFSIIWTMANVLTVVVRKVEMDIVGNANKNGENLATNKKNHNQNENGTSLNRSMPDFCLR